MADDDVILRVELGGDGGDESSSSGSPPGIVGGESAVESEIARVLGEIRTAGQRTNDNLSELSDLIRRLTDVVEAADDDAETTFIPEPPPVAIKPDEPIPTRDWVQAELVPAVADAIAKNQPTGQYESKFPWLDDPALRQGKSVFELLGIEQPEEPEPAAGSESAAAGGAAEGILAAGASFFGGPIGQVAAGVFLGDLGAQAFRDLTDALAGLISNIEQAISDVQEMGREFSAVAAQADGVREARLTFARRDAALATEESTAALTEAQTRRDTAMIELKAAVADALIPALLPFIEMATIFFRLATPVVKLLGIILKPLGKLIDLLLALPLLRLLDDTEEPEAITEQMRRFLDPAATERELGRRARGGR